MQITDEDRASITANNIMNDIINLDIKGEDCGLAMDKVYANIMKLIEDVQTGQWQDISTAPEDEEILFLFDDGLILNGYFTKVNRVTEKLSTGSITYTEKGLFFLDIYGDKLVESPVKWTKVKDE